MLLLLFGSLLSPIWRCEEKPFKFGFYQISQTALNAFSTIVFVIIMLLGWQGRVYSMMFATIVFGIISLGILYKRGYLSFTVSKEYVRSTLFYALPIIPHALSFWFRSGADKIMLTEMCGLSENGLYSVAMTWGAIVTMFLTSFNNAYAPYLYKKLSFFDKDRKGTLVEQKHLVRLIWRSIFFLSGCYLMFVCFIHYTFKTKCLGMITFSLSLFQIGMSFLLIKCIGAVGAAISSAIVEAIIFLLIAQYAMKVYKLPWFAFRN